MSRQRVVAAWTALLAVVATGAGCAAPSLGELTFEACSDLADNDGDNLYDCDDPDCQIFEHCRRHDAGSPGDAGPVTPPTMDAGRPPDASFDAAPPNGGSGGSVGPPVTPVPDDDAGGAEPVVEPCGGICRATEECIDDQCKSVVATSSGRFKLGIMRATLPDKDLAESCYDPCTPPVQFFACPCRPDPYVVIYRSTADGQEELVGMTGVAEGTLDASYPGDAFALELSQGDALRVEVWDADDPDRDDFIYGCRPDLSTLETGLVSCTAVVGSVLAGIIFGVDATLTPLP